MTVSHGRIRRESQYHADLMASYYAAREAQDAEAESATQQYDAELAEFYGAHKRVTFREWLVEYSAAMGYRDK
jgi:phage terminase Nu1 subunit (DNA packaging protein)